LEFTLSYVLYQNIEAHHFLNSNAESSEDRCRISGKSIVSVVCEGFRTAKHFQSASQRMWIPMWNEIMNFRGNIRGLTGFPRHRQKPGQESGSLNPQTARSKSEGPPVMKRCVKAIFHQRNTDSNTDTSISTETHTPTHAPWRRRKNKHNQGHPCTHRLPMMRHQCGLSDGRSTPTWRLLSANPWGLSCTTRSFHRAPKCSNSSGTKPARPSNWWPQSGSERSQANLHHPVLHSSMRWHVPSATGRAQSSSRHRSMK
jgi:hypothetical protein